MLVSASLLYQLLIQGRYLALRGTVLNAEQTMIRKHTKVIILEAEGKALRIQLRNRHMKVAQGDIVRVCSACCWSADLSHGNRRLGSRFAAV